MYDHGRRRVDIALRDRVQEQLVESRRTHVRGGVEAGQRREGSRSHDPFGRERQSVTAAKVLVAESLKT